ncbi:hypothetical protein Tco_1313781 [Tanacetum coccineum]
MMSSPNRSTSDIEDAFSSMNILNYTSVSSDYFPVSLGSNSFNSSENSNDNMIPPVFSSFYNNTYLKDVQAIYAKELPISSPDPITPPAILTLSSILPPSLLFDPQYFFVPKELLPPKKMPPKRTSTSETPAITLAAIRQLINDGISSALKAQAASMASASNPNKNTGTSGTPVARKGINDHKRKFEDRGNTTNNNKPFCLYMVRKEGSRPYSLFEQPQSVFSRSRCADG